MDPNFKVLTNVKHSNLRQPVIQNRFRKLTLNSPAPKTKPSTALPEFSQRKPNNDKNLLPTVPSNAISQSNTLTNKLMLSSSSNNTTEQQTNFVHVETEPFTERLQLSDTEQEPDTTHNDDLVTQMGNLEVSQRVSQDMFSQSTTKSSQFYLPPNRVVSTIDESIESISQRMLNIKMSDSHNDILPETVSNTSSQVTTQSNQSLAETVANTQPPVIESNDEVEGLANAVSKNPLHKFSEGRLQQRPISLSSDGSEDDKNLNNSLMTEDNSEDDDDKIIEISSSDEEGRHLGDISTLSSRKGEISETVAQKLNDFFDNIPSSVSESSYLRNVYLNKHNEATSNNVSDAISEIVISETSSSNNDVEVVDVSGKDESPVPQLEGKNEDANSVVLNSFGSIESLEHSGESSNLDVPHQSKATISTPKALESQFSSLSINSPKINISAKIKINIQLSLSSSSSSDTNGSSDYIDSSLPRDSIKNTESKQLSEISVEESMGEDQFKKVGTDAHTTDSLSRESDIGDPKGNVSDVGSKTDQNDETQSEISQSDASVISDPKGNVSDVGSKTGQNDETQSEISQSDASVIEPSQICSTKKVVKSSSLQAKDDSYSSNLNSSQIVTRKSKNVIATTIKSPAVKIPTPKPVYKQPSDDSLCQTNEIDKNILNKPYGDDWKTPQMVKMCNPVNSKYLTVIPKLNNTHDFSLFHRDRDDLESTRITAVPSTEPRIAYVPSNKNSTNQGTEDAQITPSQLKRCTEQVNSMNGDKSSIILRSGRKVTANRVLDYSSEEDEPKSDFSDDSFKPKLSDDEVSDSSCEVVPPPTARKKKNQLVYLDLTHHEVIEDEDHENPDASSEDLENISIMFLQSLECNTAIKTPMPKKNPISSIRSKRKLFTPNYENDAPFNDDKTPVKTPTSIDRKTVKLKTPIPTYLIPPQFRGRELVTINEITPTAKITPISAPKSINRKQRQTPIVTTSVSNRVCGFLESLDANIIPDAYCHPDALKFRSNFKANRDELTKVLTKLYNEHVFDRKLSDVVVSWNKSLRKTAGVCKYRKRAGIRVANVELSDKVATESYRLRDTLIHELCHAATWIFDGETGHGKYWKSWTKKAIERLPELPEIGRCHNYDIQYKYTYKCTICGLKSQYHTKSKKIENIRCSSCHGAIEVFLNKVDKDGKITLVPPKEPSGFPKFVKECYKLYKTPGKGHADIMRILSSNFAKLTLQEKLKYNKC